VIANPRRLPIDTVLMFAIQLAMAKYPYVLAGQTIPTKANEIAAMPARAILGALLFENLIWRIRRMRKGPKRLKRGK
jgi:hypothetical protein